MADTFKDLDDNHARLERELDRAWQRFDKLRWQQRARRAANKQPQHEVTFMRDQNQKNQNQKKSR